MARHSAKHAKRSSTPIAIPRLRQIGVLFVVGVAMLLIALGAYVLRSGLLGGAPTPGAVSSQRVVSRFSAPAADTSATPIEIPTLVGLKVDEATMVLKAAGLTQVIRREAPGRSAEPTVSSQDPAAGALAKSGSVVTLVVPAVPAGKGAGQATVKRGAYIVCIDPGHQSHTDSKTEPVGPGSALRKPRITGGTTGALTDAPEYETVLQIATNLKRRLEAAGVKVVMTRTTNDVNLSNAERAQIANAAGANLFVRLHADSSTNPSVSGVSTLCPASLGWTVPIAASSRRAAGIVQTALVKNTRAVDRGTAERTDLAGFNFSTVPAVLVAVGYPSNRVEDRLLVSPNYQDQVAQGLTDGILVFLRGQR